MTRDQTRSIKKRPTLAGMSDEYLTKLPTTVPEGRILVHNHVRPTRRLGSRGFRAWLSTVDADRLEVCECGWAPELGAHYRVRGVGSLRG